MFEGIRQDLVYYQRAGNCLVNPEKEILCIYLAGNTGTGLSIDVGKIAQLIMDLSCPY